LWFETIKTTIPCFIKHSYNYFSTGVFSLASRHLPRIKKLDSPLFSNAIVQQNVVLHNFSP